ncbi:MAG: hypothetical protein U9R74_12095 [Pseudomonadota bacterium]|nr:hypothetical protein [Pseudomonadota bacterium]
MRHDLLGNAARLPRFILSALLPLAAASAMADQELVLEEQLNTTWTEEPVSFDIEAKTGECHPDAVRLRGPRGPIPSQLSDVVTWPGTPFLKSASIWLVTDLQPLQRLVFTVACNDRAADASAPVPSGDFRLEQGNETATMTTSKFGIRLRLGNGSDTMPVASGKVPGPLESMRLAGGAWFGGSDFYGDTRIRAWSSELTAAGPVFGEVRYRYEYEDGNRLELKVRLFARSDRVQFDADVLDDHRDEGLRIVLSHGLPPLTLHVQKLWWGRRDIYPDSMPIGEWARLPLDDVEPGLVTSVSPWGPWWGDMQSPVVRLGIGEGARELQIARRDPASWVRPLGPAKHKSLSVRKSESGETYIDLNLAAGETGGIRKFDLAISEPTEAVGWRHRRDRHNRRVGSQVIPYREGLDQVRRYVLDWPKTAKHPRIYMDAEEVAASRCRRIDANLLARLEARAKDPVPAVPHHSDSEALALWLLSGDDAVARKYHLAERLIHYLGLLGDFDKMRHTVRVAALYDAIIDSDLITPEQRTVLRAQMAYLAYQVACPATWSNERGWNSGNQNMTVSYTLQAPGVMAAVLADHPMAREWMEPALEVMEFMLDRVGPAGKWPESSGYANLSVDELVTFAILATRAGFGDYVNDPGLRRAVTFLVKIRQPPDPRTGGMRDHIRFGRSPGRIRALDGAMARATRKSDPAYSRHMEWTWLDTLRPGAESTVLDMGGFEFAYLDPTLPREPPDWGSEVFPHMGVIFRRGFGTDREHFAALLSGDHPAMIYGSQTGGLVSLAFGKPVAGSFLGDYGDQSEFLINRVSLARDPRQFVAGETPFEFRGAAKPGWWFDERRTRAVYATREGDGNIHAFSSLPRQDYAAVDVLLKHPVTFGKAAKKMKPPGDLPWPELKYGEGKPPLWWRRQALYVKGGKPDDPTYLILRDTVRGDQPTMWTFWSDSEKLVTPEEVADRKPFLADAPGNVIVPPRRIEGNRFTALGSWGVDLDYFIAAPTDTPRYTLRWGKSWKVSRPWGVTQFQDLLHLQRKDDGEYFVALFPRLPDTPAPEFETLGDGKIIRVSGAFGTDYAFLSSQSGTATAGPASFQGTAGSIQEHAGQTILTLGDAGRVSFGRTAIESETPVTLSILPTALGLRLPKGHGGSTIRLRAPSVLDLTEPPTGTVLTAHRKPGEWQLFVPPRTTGLRIERQAP